MKKNRKFYRLALLCLFLTIHFYGKAQENQAEDSLLRLPTERYLTFGLGSMAIQLNDEHMSPLNYHGGAFHLQLGAYKRKKGSLRNLSFRAAYASIGPVKDNREIDPKGQYFRFDISYAQQQYIRSVFNNTTRWYLGGRFKSHSNVRLNEQLDGAFITFIFANGLFLSSALERDIKISGRPLTINWQVDLPIVNHTIRPEYLNIYDFVNPESDWGRERIQDSKWRAIDSYSNITSTVSFLYPISTSNMLRFSYEWEFYRIASELKATNATHTYSFSFLFHF